MTHEEARGLHDAFLRDARDRTPRLVPREWESPARIEERTDSWVFVYREAHPSDPSLYEAVVIRKDRSGPYILRGAIGRASRVAEADLGLPRSNERWLGSGPGRYQAFDGGLLVWHEDPGLAYARRIPPEITTGRRCLGLVAFLDLRGFSRWSRRRNPRDVQAVMSILEDILQDALNRIWCRLVFVKGLGDGMMIVSESEWFAQPGWSGPSDRQSSPELQPRPEHLCALLRACGQFILEGQAAIPRELAIGCGIDVGELNQVFLFGQSDYLGEPVNNAAELQQLAWNEIIISPRFADGLAADGGPGDGRAGGVPLADRGIRIDPKACA